MGGGWQQAGCGTFPSSAPLRLKAAATSPAPAFKLNGIGLNQKWGRKWSIHCQPPVAKLGVILTIRPNTPTSLTTHQASAVAPTSAAGAAGTMRTAGLHPCLPAPSAP